MAVCGTVEAGIAAAVMSTAGVRISEAQPSAGAHPAQLGRPSEVDRLWRQVARVCVPDLLILCEAVDHTAQGIVYSDNFLNVLPALLVWPLREQIQNARLRQQNHALQQQVERTLVDVALLPPRPADVFIWSMYSKFDNLPS